MRACSHGLEWFGVVWELDHSFLPPDAIVRYAYTAVPCKKFYVVTTSSGRHVMNWSQRRLIPTSWRRRTVNSRWRQLGRRTTTSDHYVCTTSLRRQTTASDHYIDHSFLPPDAIYCTVGLLSRPLQEILRRDDHYVCTTSLGRQRTTSDHYVCTTSLGRRTTTSDHCVCTTSLGRIILCPAFVSWKPKNEPKTFKKPKSLKMVKT